MLIMVMTYICPATYKGVHCPFMRKQICEFVFYHFELRFFFSLIFPLLTQYLKWKPSIYTRNHFHFDRLYRTKYGRRKNTRFNTLHTFIHLHPCSTHNYSSYERMLFYRVCFSSILPFFLSFVVLTFFLLSWYRESDSNVSKQKWLRQLD